MATKEPPEDIDDYPYNECMNCSSVWSPGTEEFDFQQCSACGWQPGDPTEEDDWESDDDFDYDDDEEDNNPNDSRNL